MLTQQAIPFELHITTAPLAPNEIEAFTAFCHLHGAKPLLIELGRGDCIEQPMVNRIVYCGTLKDALGAAGSLVVELTARRWPVTRLKIEIPAYHANDWNSKENAFACYFEWHGKVKGEPTAALLLLCEQYGAHLSINALKKELSYRFVTLREYGGEQVFEQRVAALSSALEQAGWPLVKEVSEYCVYDNNINLDKGWLSN